MPKPTMPNHDEALQLMTCAPRLPTMFGMDQLLVVLVVVLLVFGPGRLPEVMGSLGKGMREFKKGFREPPEIEAPSAPGDAAAKTERDG
jgi:sec-independent protein translocase protein TatA